MNCSCLLNSSCLQAREKKNKNETALAMNILDKIIAQKRIEVEERKSNTSVAELQQRPLYARPVLSLKQFLLDDSKTGIIAEFKRQSPIASLLQVLNRRR